MTKALYRQATLFTVPCRRLTQVFGVIQVIDASILALVHVLALGLKNASCRIPRQTALLS